MSWCKRFPARVVAYVLYAVLPIILLPVYVRALPGDVNSSGRVDGYDLIIFSRAYGLSAADPDWNPDADLDGNGTVNQTDLNILSAHFGNTGLSFGLWAGDEYGNDRGIFKLSSTGSVLKKVGNVSRPFSISANVADGSVWVADAGNDQVRKLANRKLKDHTSQGHKTDQATDRTTG